MHSQYQPKPLILCDYKPMLQKSSRQKKKPLISCSLKPKKVNILKKTKNANKSSIAKATIEITNRCGLSCIHCSSSANRNSDDFLNLEIYKKIVKDLSKMGISELDVSGGEPLLHPDIINILKFSSNLNFQTFYLYTCGIIQKNGKLRPIPWKIIKELKKIPKLMLRLSFHSCFSHEFEEITAQPGSFEMFQKSILRLRKSKISFEIHIVPNKINCNSIESTIIYAKKKLHASNIKIIKLVLQGRASENHEKLSFSEAQEERLQEAIKKTKLKFPEIDVCDAFESNCCYSCGAGIKKLVVRPNADIIPCSALKDIATPFNCNQISLYPLLIEQNFLKQYLKVNLIPCKSCTHYVYCNERCLGQKFHCTKVKKSLRE